VNKKIYNILISPDQTPTENEQILHDSCTAYML